LKALNEMLKAFRYARKVCTQTLSIWCCTAILSTLALD